MHSKIIPIATTWNMYMLKNGKNEEILGTKMLQKWFILHIWIQNGYFSTHMHNFHFLYFHFKNIQCLPFSVLLTFKWNEIKTWMQM